MKDHKTYWTFLDLFFWYSSLFMSIVMLVVYTWGYGFGLDEKFFAPYSYLYYFCVTAYAIEHKIWKQRYPSDDTHRTGELFVVGWIAVCLIVSVITLFWHEKLDRFVDLIIMTAFIAGIFGFGQAIKLIKLPLIEVEKKE